MHTFKDITIDDKQIFDKALRNAKPEASELTFANLFIWRNDYNFTYSIINDMLCIISNCKSYVPFAFCPLPLEEFDEHLFKKTICEIVKYFNSKSWEVMFARIEEKYKDLFSSCLKRDFVAEEIRDIADYVYKTEKLATLKGKKMSKKRNHINKFLKLYHDYQYEKITNENKKYCFEILDKWSKAQNNNEEKQEQSELDAISDALKYFEELELKGALIKVNGEYEAFTIGELLNDNTAVIHIEKGNSNIHGIYPIINKEFINTEFKNTEYINREEDMGIEGIRKAKLSYYPDKFIKKYIIKFSNSTILDLESIL